jgi:hypothetical protein
VQVTFTPKISGQAGKPQQAMLMASSKAHGGLAAYAVAKAKKDGTHTATLGTAAIEKQIANVVSTPSLLALWQTGTHELFQGLV